MTSKNLQNEREPKWQFVKKLSNQEKHLPFVFQEAVFIGFLQIFELLLQSEHLLPHLVQFNFLFRQQRFRRHGI